MSELTSVYNSENHLIITKPVGEINRVNLQATVKKSIDLAIKQECLYLLFDISDCFVLRSFLEGFTDMTKFGETMGIGQEYFCAVYYDVNTYPRERAAFIENVVNTMINPPFKMFNLKKDAIIWLVEKQSVHTH